MARTRSTDNDQSDNPLGNILAQHLSLLVFLAITFGIVFAVSRYFSTPQIVNRPLPLTIIDGTQAEQSRQTMNQRYTQSPGPLRVAIIAGHKDSDSGAVCDDGLTEASITLDITNRVLINLARLGVTGDILSEFDSRLTGYQSDAVVSIHADSCTAEAASLSGYKTAAAIDPASSALKGCLDQKYAAGTGLGYNEYTVTRDMIDYHAFRAVAPQTPIVIIEVGFMGLDRNLLTINAQIPADAITEGIVCFLE